MLISLLEELAESFGSLSAFSIDVLAGIEGSILIAAAFLDEVVLTLIVVVHTLPEGDFFLG
jgi:hypothetical protein